MPKITVRELKTILADFPWDRYNRELRPEFSRITRDTIRVSGEAAAADAGGQWDDANPLVSRFATQYVGERITSLDETTKDQVSDLVRGIFADNASLSYQEIGGLIGDAVRDQFENYEGYRALAIARTEDTISTNHGSVLGYSQAGVEEVDVLDGTDDDECASANGEVWTLDEALDDPAAHTNCTRVFSPRPVADENRRRWNLERYAKKNWVAAAIRAAKATRNLWSKADPHGRPIEDPDEDAA